MRDECEPDGVAVCVPVRDEEALLPRLLAALSAQQAPPDTSIVLCFLLDACRDGSAGILARFAECSSWPVRTTSASGGTDPNAGRARSLAMAMGDAAVAGHRFAALLTTDADSAPAPDWIAACCTGLALSDVVVGRIVREASPANPVQDRLEAYYDRLYWLRRRHDPVPWEGAPGHHGVGGANLAFRADAYRALGGFPLIAAGEDSAIVDAAHRLGLRVRRDRNAVVTTSARHHGRAVDGMADHLRVLARDAGLPMVAHPDDAVWQYRAHAAARASQPGLHDPATVARLAAFLGVDVGHVARVAAGTANAEAFATHVVPAAPGSGRLIALDIAEDVLARLERAAYERAA